MLLKRTFVALYHFVYGASKECIEIQSVGEESLAVYFNDVTVFHIYWNLCIAIQML